MTGKMRLRLYFVDGEKDLLLGEYESLREISKELCMSKYELLKILQLYELYTDTFDSKFKIKRIPTKCDICGKMSNEKHENDDCYF